MYYGSKDKVEEVSRTEHTEVAEENQMIRSR